MSEALTYLTRARPDAMGHYFQFLKACGTHLDPKTRALISVITKVHAQTERGLRQYLGRALREGCTAPEILDALLMAFPALGLAKIVWAVDVILAMKLPQFELQALASAAAPAAPAASVRWHDLLATRGFKVGGTRRVACDGRSVFVYRSPEAWHVYDSLCPHQSTEIPELALQGCTLTCPKHEWAFDIRSGECIRKGNTPLRRWPCRVEKGRLLAQW